MTTTTSVTILDPETAPDGVVGAFNPAELDMTANSRADAEGTVTAEDVAGAKAMAGVHDYGCGNAMPAELRRLPDGTLRVRDGHRRAIMCQRAGVPLFAFVNGPEGDEQADQRAKLVTQWFANHHNEAPARSDDTRLMLALFDLGMTPTGIGKALGGMKKRDVDAALAVARSPLASKAADEWRWLSLEQSAALEEFAGDEAAITDLVQAARNGGTQWDHTLTRLRDTAGERAARAAFEAEVTAAGHRIYGDRSWVPWTLDLANLTDPDGTPLDPAEHAKSCEGAHVTIGYDWSWKPGALEAYKQISDLTGEDGDDIGADDFDDDDAAREAGMVLGWAIGSYLCNDPDTYGHVNKLGKPADPSRRGEQASAEDLAAAAAKKSEERKRILAGNKAWRRATETRLGHLSRLLAGKDLRLSKNATAAERKTLAEAADLLVGEAIARGETQGDGMMTGHELAARLLGYRRDDGRAEGRERILAEQATATPARRLVIRLGMVLAAAEGADKTWGSCADVHTWQRAETSGSTYGRDYYGRDSRAGRYLAWLETHTGYTLTDLEQTVAHGRPEPARQDDDPPKDDGGEPPATAPAGQVDTGAGLDGLAGQEHGMTVVVALAGGPEDPDDDDDDDGEYADHLDGDTGFENPDADPDGLGEDE